MATKSEKKRKKTGALLAFLFGCAVVGLLFAFTLHLPKKEQEKVTLIEFDFSGSVAKGGNSSPNQTETKKQETTPINPQPINTQKEESVIKKNKTKQTPKTQNTAQTVNNKAVAGSGTFGGNTSGSGSGNNNGSGSGLGNGQSGPGISGKIGTLKGRGVVYKPKVINPVKTETGFVAVEVLVRKDGTVESVRVLSNSSKTTTSNPAHFAEAEKKAFQFKFAASSNAYELEKTTITIQFTLG